MKVLNNNFPDNGYLKLIFEDYDYSKFDTDLIRKRIDEIDDLAGKIIYLEWLKKEADEILKLSNDKIFDSKNNQHDYRLMYKFKNKISKENEKKIINYGNTELKKLIESEEKKEEFLSLIRKSMEQTEINRKLKKIPETQERQSNILYSLAEIMDKKNDERKDADDLMNGMGRVLNILIARWEDKHKLNCGCTVSFFGDTVKYVMMNIIMEDVTKFINENIDFWKNRLILQKQNTIVKEVITKSVDKKNDASGISKVQWRGEDTDLYYTLNELENIGFLTAIDKENFLNIIELYFLDKRGKSFGDKRTKQGINNLLINKGNKSKSAFKIDAILEKTQKTTKIKKDK